MTGQEATNVAKGFHDRLGVTGVILTKMDGDTRGGAALSIHSVTGAPIKFVGVGEKLAALEPFYPERLASRILGMGDTLTLIEKTQSLYTAGAGQEARAEDPEAELYARRLPRSDAPGAQTRLDDRSAQDDSRSLAGAAEGLRDPRARVRQSRGHHLFDDARASGAIPMLLNGSRRKRIALGSGTQVSDVNRLVKQFDQARQMMKQLGGKRRRLPLSRGKTLSERK